MDSLVIDFEGCLKRICLLDYFAILVWLIRILVASDNFDLIDGHYGVILSSI